jgi:predicted esterase
MKTPLIFLHGKGKRPDEPLFKEFEQIATSFDADLIPITAKFPHREGFRWHNINKQPETKTEFFESLRYIDLKTQEILASRKQDWNDVIWLGYSQGSDMAIRMALSRGAKRAIVFFADIIAQIELPAAPKTNFQVDWIEAGKDNVLKPERKQSYKKLESMGVAVNHILSENSRHWYIQETDTIIENIDIKDYINFIKQNIQLAGTYLFRTKS